MFHASLGVGLHIEGFFDNVPHDLIVKAVEANTDKKWVVLYVKRWLVAPMQHPDGSLHERDRGIHRVPLCHLCWPTSSSTTRSTCG